MSDQSLQSFLALATRLGNESTDLAMRSFGVTAGTLKPDRTIVTEIDHQIQAHILDSIARSFPDHAVIAEEKVQVPGAHAKISDARYCWVIDPLDGTRNYALGFGCFATSIAVLDRGEPVVAVVVEHNIRATYTATKGGGAFVRISGLSPSPQPVGLPPWSPSAHEGEGVLRDGPIGRPLHAGTPPDGHDWLIGVPSSKDELSVRAVSKWSATKGLICRNLGTAAYHLALVASGAFAGTFCKQCKIWDVAAGVLLVTEAGGVCTGISGEPLTPFRLDGNLSQDIPTIAATPQAHQVLQGTLS